MRVMLGAAPPLCQGLICCVLVVCLWTPTTLAQTTADSHRFALCSEVGQSLRRIANSISDCDTTMRLHANGSALGKRSERGVDLSPIRRMMIDFGCTQDTANSPGHARTAQVKTARPQNKTSLLDPATSTSPHTGVHKGSTEQQACARSTRTSLAHAAVRPQSPAHRSRVRREEQGNSTTASGTCMLTQIFDATCAGPSAAGRLFIVFHNNDSIPSSSQATAHLQALSTQVLTLFISGVVHEEPLLWLLEEGNWTRAFVVHVEGLHFHDLALSVFNGFESIIDIFVEDNEDIDISTDGFVRAQQIEWLGFANNSLTRLPEDAFSGFTSLTLLELQSNRLTHIGAQHFASATQLSHLNLQENRIRSIDARAFRTLSALTFLNLEFNDVSFIHEETFGSLTALRDLYLGHNPLLSLPPKSLASLTSLEELFLDGLLLTELPSGVFSHLTRLTRLHLEFNFLTTLPSGVVANLPALRTLDLSDNRLASLHVDALAGLNGLRHLNLDNNALTALPTQLLRECNGLTFLSVQQNALTFLPSQLLAPTPDLVELFVSSNELTSLDEALVHTPRLELLVAFQNRLTALGVTLPALTGMAMSQNPMVTLPNVARMPNLTILRLQNHHISTLDLTPLLELEWLNVLEVQSAPGVQSRAVVDRQRLSTWTGNNLRTLRMKNVDVSSFLVEPVALPREQFEILELGWPGLDESVLPIDDLCPLLRPVVRELGIGDSNYTHINLCPRKRFLAVSLEDSKLLQSLTLHNHLEQLNVSNCHSLKLLNAPSVEVLDMSGTQLQPGSALCTSLGYRMLFARNLPAGAFETTQAAVALGHCLRLVDVLDLSDNAWLSQPAVANEFVSTPVALSDQFFLTLNFQPLLSRLSPPVFQLQNAPIQCTIVFEPQEVRPSGTSSSVAVTQVVYSFTCTCAQGHTLTSGGRCVNRGPDIAAIVAGSLVGGLVILVPVVLWLYRRYRRSSNKVVLHQQLLSERDEEVIALKKAWEIGYDELRKTKRVAAGAFGVVYKAQWDTVTVAVKVLQQDVFTGDDSTVEEFEKEVEFLRRTRHPHVVRFFGAGTDPSGSPFLVLEFVALGSLTDLLEKDMGAVVRGALARSAGKTEGDEGGSVGGEERGDWESVTSMAVSAVDEWPDTTHSGSCNRRSEQDGGSERDSSRPRRRRSAADVPETAWKLKLRILHDVADGMAFIHSLDQVHRDLKSGNVLVTSSLHAKITDFGSIRRCFTRKESRGSRDRGQRCRKSFWKRSASSETEPEAEGLVMDMAGTPAYMAPEVLLGTGHSPQADVFSFGVLMWEVATQREPDLVAQEKGAGIAGLCWLRRPTCSWMENAFASQMKKACL